MKQGWLLLWLLLVTPGIRAQVQPGMGHMIRIYEDNDFMNLRGKGTDRAYTNGTRIDYYFTPANPGTLRPLLPRAGRNAINIHSWSLMQIMITPGDITSRNYQPHDYPYAGALFAGRALASYNPGKKYSLHSELVAGVMGPMALAKEAQVLIHRIIHYQRPMGWRNQLPNDVLLNYNLGVEKMLWSPWPAVELLAAAGLSAGTMLTGGVISGTLRFGYMDPYFGIPRGSGASYHRWQLYGFVRPSASLVLHNSLLQGGVFSRHSSRFKKEWSFHTERVNSYTTQLDYGLMLTFRRWALGYTQKTHSPPLKGANWHEVGNISLYIPL